MLTGDSVNEASPSSVGKLAMLFGVCKFPARVKCASLAWHTANAALKNEQQPVKTE